MKQHFFFGIFCSILWMVGCTPAPVLTALPEIDTGINPEAWALIPAGEFFQGQHDHETLIEYDYEIMITTVTNTQFAQFLNAAGQDGSIIFADGQPFGFYGGDEFQAHKHEEEILAGDYMLAELGGSVNRITQQDGSYGSIPGYASHPVTGVTWFGARAYCLYYGWRLPTEVEWEKAARGSDIRPFPWGDTIEPGNANYYSSHDIFEKLAGKSDTTPVGFFNGRVYDDFQTIASASPYGLYDMAGNVWQWAGDVYPGQHYRYLRGGSKENYAYNLRIWTRNSAAPDYASPNVGFRCARQQ